MLGRTIDDRPHALLHGHVLRVHALDAGEARRPLPFTIDQVVIRAVALGSISRQQVVRTSPRAPLALRPLLRRKRSIDFVGVEPVIAPCRRVIDRHPDVAFDPRRLAFRDDRRNARRAHLLRRHQKLICPNPLFAAVKPQRRILIPVVRRLDVEIRTTHVLEEAAVANILVMENRKVRRVEAALERLQVVAFLKRLRCVT